MFLEKTKSSLAVAILFVLSLGLAVKPAMSANAKAFASQVNVTPSQIPHPTPSIAFVKEELKVVTYGDNLWNLAKQVYWNGWNFGDLVAQNKFLQEPGRLYYDKKNNWFYVMIHPGEKLMTYQPTEPQVIPIGHSETVKDDTAGFTPTPPAPGPYVPPPATTDWDEFAKWFWIIVLALLLLFVLYKIFLLRREKSEADPIGSGDPQVKGGVTDENAAQRIMNIAEARGFNPLKVTNIQRGRLYGRGNVSYANIPSGLIKRFRGEVGYRGIILRTDGTQQTIYFLQPCGNDAQERFFTHLDFVADEIQPEVLRSYNDANRVPIEVLTTEDQKGSSKEPAPKPFNWQEEYLKIIDKAVEGDKKIFFEFMVGSTKIRFNSTGKNPVESQSKSSEKS